MKKFTTALIIATYNSTDALRLVLQSVLRQTVMPDEVIIADDGSRAETKTLIDEMRSQIPTKVKHVWHEDTGFRLAEIRNKAIIASASDYIIQVDGDIIMDKHFVADHVAHAKENTYVAGSRAQIREAHTPAVLKRNHYVPRFYHKALRAKENALRMPWVTPLCYAKARVIGCNMAFWKKDLVMVNGYDEDFVGWGHEDLCIANRLLNAGVKRRHLKFSAVCYHIWHKFAPRDNDEEYYKKATDLLGSGIIRAEKGIDSHAGKQDFVVYE